MSFLLSGIYSISSPIITSVFIIIEYMFQYFVTFVVDIIENPYLLFTGFALFIIIYYSPLTNDITVDVTNLRYPRRKTKKNGQDKSYQENRNSRDQTGLPPIYPNGWIPLMESKDLAVGQSVPITALGHQFVIFRGKTGKSFILDAYCPHLGANLGVCGKVQDDCIRCPFHGWIFSGHDGSCVKIPYTDKVPEFAKTKSWLSIEQNGFIYVWYHADGQKPSWIPPVIPEVEQGLWSYKGRDQYTINCHIQEITENLADFAHNNYLHQANIFLDINSDNWKNIFKNIFTAYSWTVDPLPNQHTVTIKFTVQFSFFGISFSWARVTLEMKQIGPAIIHIYYNSIFGRMIQIVNTIPEGPLKIKQIHYFYCPYRFFQVIIIIFRVLLQDNTERDILIWNNKIYRKNPLLVSEDKLILKFRKWYSQFYSDNSSKLDKNTLNW